MNKEDVLFILKSKLKLEIEGKLRYACTDSGPYDITARLILDKEEISSSTISFDFEELLLRHLNDD